MIFMVVIVLIITGVCLLNTSTTKKAQMTNFNYYQQPYSDNDMRVSCFFEPEHQNPLSYCPPVNPEPPRRRRRRRARVPSPDIPTAAQFMI